MLWWCLLAFLALAPLVQAQGPVIQPPPIRFQSDCSTVTALNACCWDTNDFQFFCGNGTAAVSVVGSLSSVVFADGETLSSPVDGTFLFGRNTAGTVTLTAADNDATAALAILPGGAASLDLGGVSMSDLTVITNDSGPSEVVLPANSINTVELSGIYDTLIFCGENVENGTTYFGPATAPLGGTWATPVNLGSAGCDALDNVTEATADAPISTLATKINGFRCVTSGTLGAAETIVFTLRTAEGNAVTTDGSQTTLTCTISTGATECRNTAGTTTNIAAGATLAMQVVQTSDNADDNAWCVATVSWP